jgi:hypothetical protein
MGGRGDDAQRARKRRVVLRRQQGRHEHQIRHAVADGAERPLRGVDQNQLGVDTLADHGRELGRLAPIRFDSKNELHIRFAT